MTNKHTLKWRQWSKLAGRAVVNKYRRVSYERKQVWMRGLKQHPCLDCKKRFPPECMDWDHVRGKKRGSIGWLQGHTREIILKEIAKCELVCANCHRIRTTRRKRRLKRKKN